MVTGYEGRTFEWSAQHSPDGFDLRDHPRLRNQPHRRGRRQPRNLQAEPGDRVQMPVTFFVDPELVDDRDAKYTKVITLSYTFYEIVLPEETALVSPDTDELTKLN